MQVALGYGTPLSAAGKAAALLLAPCFHQKRRNLYPSGSALPGYTLARARGKYHLARFSSQGASEVWSRQEEAAFPFLQVLAKCRYLSDFKSRREHWELPIQERPFHFLVKYIWLNVSTALLLLIGYLHSIAVP